jgi:hypothetical protein
MRKDEHVTTSNDIAKTGSTERFRRQSAPQLAPLTIADVLDGVFSLLRSNWRATSTAVLLFSLPLGAIAVLSNVLLYGSDNVGGIRGLFIVSEDTSDGALLGGLALLGIQILYYVLAFPMLAAIITRVTMAEFLGHQLSFESASRSTARIWPRLIGTSLVTSACVGAAFSFCFIAALPIAVMLAAAVPAVAVEETGISQSISRSWTLMAPRFWKNCLTLLAIVVVGYYVSSIVSVIPTLIGWAIATMSGVDWIYLVFTAIGSVLQNLVLLPLLATGSLLLYLDARIRHEGYDIYLQFERLQSRG